MKKFLMLITVMLCVLCGVLGLVACGEQNAPHVHDFTDYIYNDDATCTEDGTETAACSCGETDTRTKTSSVLGHDMQPVKAQDPTCTTIGWEKHSACSRCGIKENYVEKQVLGHDYQDDFCTRCHEQKPSDGLLYILTNDGKSYMAAGLGSCQEKDIAVASIYNGKLVTEIGANAFEYADITSVKIPNTVVAIGTAAFLSCRGLTSVSIPDSVSSIGKDAFQYCNQLNETHISNLAVWCKIDFENAYANPLYFGHHLFIGNEEITELEIPNGVTSIGFGAFFGCSELTKITIPNSVTSIEQSAFHSCSQLTEIEIPNSVTSIGGSVFCECNRLTSVTLPNSVKTIGYYAFNGCSSLTSITIPRGVTCIGDCAFNGCSSLTSITIPRAVTFIGNHAFSDCTGLTEIIFPDYMILAAIGDCAFSGCSELTSVTIGSGVISIGMYAFSDCTKLTSIIIPNSVTEIGSSAFEGCNGLTSVTFEDPTGWSCGDIKLDAAVLQDLTTAAVYLTKNYQNYIWRKEKTN